MRTGKIKNKIIVLISLTLSLVSCKEMDYFDSKFYPDQNIYFVRFIKKGGVLEGNTMYCYITDSTSFTRYLGHVDDKEFYKLRLNGNELVVGKYSRRNWNSKNPQLLNEDVYNISDLKKEGGFED